MLAIRIDVVVSSLAPKLVSAPSLHSKTFGPRCKRLVKIRIWALRIRRSIACKWPGLFRQYAVEAFPKQFTEFIFHEDVLLFLIEEEQAVPGQGILLLLRRRMAMKGVMPFLDDPGSPGDGVDGRCCRSPGLQLRDLLGHPWWLG